MSGFEKGIITGYEACLEDLVEVKDKGMDEAIAQIEKNLEDIRETFKMTDN